MNSLSILNKSDSLRIKSEKEIKQEASDDVHDLKTKRDYLTVSSRKTLPDYLSTGNSSLQKIDSNQFVRNSLSTNFCHFTERGNSDRASSIDNSSISSNNTSFERQESRDSGFSNLNKNSFDSTNSFSLGMIKFFSKKLFRPKK